LLRVALTAAAIPIQLWHPYTPKFLYNADD
jgi:hypothetical protein